MISNSAPPSQPIAYYPVYTTHTGHLYIASPPLHPTSSHPTKILPKLPHTFQTPPSPVALSPASTPFYHPYQPPITPPSALPPSSHYSTADQREQARKVSHSAIERRRRERINDKIMQLKQLIPTCAKQDHLHKMSILQSAIDYITFLKEIVESNEKAQNASPLKPKDLLSSKKSASTVTPSEAGTIPTNMSVKNLLC
ncbi:Myc-type, basic helix-loop-helix domain-containing protein [Chlamydoabsidia padenii]|nr:Myc-type, basic helix-loop-helix domain-containing protein [Chlamydoabsidia padenii]